MRRFSLGAVLSASVLILAACGRLASSSGTAPESPSALPTSSPTAQSAPLAVPPVNFHVGEAGLTYAPVPLTASGGTPPYFWVVGSGSLPSGLTISPEGVIAGTPSAAGEFPINVAVTDTASTTVNLTGAIKIMPPVVISDAGYNEAAPGYADTISVCVEARADHPCDPLRVRTSGYTPFATVSGGSPPYTYAIEQADLTGLAHGAYNVVFGSTPPGTTLEGLGLKGQFGTGLGTYIFRVAVTDSLGAKQTIDVEFDLYRM